MSDLEELHGELRVLEARIRDVETAPNEQRVTDMNEWRANRRSLLDRRRRLLDDIAEAQRLEEDDLGGEAA